MFIVDIYYKNGDSSGTNREPMSEMVSALCTPAGTPRGRYPNEVAFVEVDDWGSKTRMTWGEFSKKYVEPNLEDAFGR